MRICIDCRYIRERPSGVGAYVRALVYRLPALAPDAELVLWRHPRAPAPLNPAPNVTEVRAVSTPNEPLSLLFPRLFGPTEGDVFHAPHNLLGYGIRTTAVVTVHDIMWLAEPHLAEGSALLRAFRAPFFRAGLLNSLARARRILTVSQASADAIVRFQADTQGRVVVAHNAVDAHFQPAADQARARAQAAALLGTDAPYFLLVGQNAPSKGHAIALCAFAAVAKPGERLVLIQRLRTGRGLYRLAQELGVADRLRVLSAVPEDGLVTLLQSAIALLQPSLAEGFGMPALEAMAAGCPVVASDVAPLVEVLGGAGLHTPRAEVGPLGAAMRRVADDAELRAELGARGIERAKAFSWDACARTTLEVYREAARLGPMA
jgi:glycosyltransferase involved in cell wall biosynthesis